MENWTQYWKNSEYAVKTVAPYWENKDKWEVFDRMAWKFSDISKLSKEQLYDLTSDVILNWHEISEEEYNKIIQEEKKS